MPKIVDRRGQPLTVELTKSEARRLQDAAYILYSVARNVDDWTDVATKAADTALAVVAKFAPKWVDPVEEDEPEVRVAP